MSPARPATVPDRRGVERAEELFLPEAAEPLSIDGPEPQPTTAAFKPYYAVGRAVFEGSGEAVAAACAPDDARRIVAALNVAYGTPTEALEAWSVGSIQDPVNDILAELESVLAPPVSQDRRGKERRQIDRRRPIHEVRIDEE
jgi:hypothetical protein